LDGLESKKMKNRTELELSIINIININKIITARSLLSQLMAENIGWQKRDMKQVLIGLLKDEHILEVEFVYKDLTNESIFVPKGTEIRK